MRSKVGTGSLKTRGKKKRRREDTIRMSRLRRDNRVKSINIRSKDMKIVDQAKNIGCNINDGAIVV